MALRKYYNRVGYVTLNEGQKVHDDFRGLNFKFSYEIMVNAKEGRVGRASVGILGLSRNRVWEWASFCNATTEQAYARALGSAIRTVAVYAGYAHTFTETPLFVLPVAGAWPTPPPEMWLNISAYTTKALSEKYYTVTMNPPLDDPKFYGFTEKQICQKVADTLGVRLRWEEWGKVNPKEKWHMPIWNSSVNWHGTAADLIQRINNGATTYAYIDFSSSEFDKPTLVVTRMERSDADRLKAAPKNPGEKNPPTISARTGMIGLPKLQAGDKTASQIEVSALLRDDIEPGDEFIVESEFLRFANRTWRATKVKYEGELRGNLWQTTITGIPPSAYGDHLKQLEKEESAKREAEEAMKNE